MSLIFFFLCKKLKLLDSTPTTASIQLADCSTRQPIGILEGVLVQVGKFVILCDFVTLDIDETSRFPSS